jgi:iron uptake system EfeUOB component EfeO/EfeM
MEACTSPGRPAPASARRALRRALIGPVTAFLGVVLIGMSAASCATSAAAARDTERAGPASTAAHHSKSRSSPRAEAERAEASSATAAFHRATVAASASLVAEVGQLQAAIDRGATLAARADELTAQADFDRIRMLDGGNTINAAALDGLASQLASGEPFGGLHAIERDLWSSGNAADDVSGLSVQAQVAEFLLAKESVSPEAIATVGADELSWMDEMAVPGREELYSHLDTVDIAATTAAAQSAFAAIQPLAQMVAPSLTTPVARQFSQLSADVAALGPPAQVADAAIPAGTRLMLSQQVDATASELAQLAATLVPFGTAGPPS